jgi:UDP-3-O-[3-hydroxymyristoyl] N-acetylglucosamine deacetylase
MFLQKTIRASTKVSGIGLHSGKPCDLVFRPAPPDTGVFFVRKDLPGEPFVKVDVKNVVATGFATTLGGEAFSVATVEHCLSAVSAFRIDNLIIELSGPEIPITDGSAFSFAEALLSVGLLELDRPRSYILVEKPFVFEEGDKRASLMPYQGLRLSVVIDFPHPLVGKQKIDLDVGELSFMRELARARTFGFFQEVEQLHARGLALGGGLHNAIVLDSDRIMNPEGLRWPDEFVRHKALDALGDLVTLGHPLLGHLSLYKAGHDFVNKFIKAFLASDTYHFVELGAAREKSAVSSDR